MEEAPSSSGSETWHECGGSWSAPCVRLRVAARFAPAHALLLESHQRNTIRRGQHGRQHRQRSGGHRVLPGFAARCQLQCVLSTSCWTYGAWCHHALPGSDHLELEYTLHGVSHRLPHRLSLLVPLCLPLFTEHYDGSHAHPCLALPSSRPHLRRRRRRQREPQRSTRGERGPRGGAEAAVAAQRTGARLHLRDGWSQ